MPAPDDLQTRWSAAVDDSDPLAALRAVQGLRADLLDWESHLARAALARGETWETIGAALGISRQAAWERLRSRISGEIEAERSRLRAERARLAEQRRKR